MQHNAELFCLQFKSLIGGLIGLD